MLYATFGEPKNMIWNPGRYFDRQYEKEWMNDDFVKEMVLDVDKSTVVKDNYIESPVLGAIPPERLSGGVKALIMMLYEPEHLYNGSACGDNCAKWMLEIAKRHDIFLWFGDVIRFPEPFEIFVKDGGKVVTTMREWAGAAIDYLPKGGDLD